jgi:hypothetical protein
MLVQMRSLDSIRPYDQNPRSNDPGVDAVAQSIREFGFRQPIVVDEDGVIVVGHTRYKAAKKLGRRSRSKRIGSPTTRPPPSRDGTTTCSCRNCSPYKPPSSTLS